ncbi:MAG: hypothetical protein R3E39_18225 [Anaerolineae bacterium]
MTKPAIALISLFCLLLSLTAVVAQNGFISGDLRRVDFDGMGEDVAEVPLTLEADDVSALLYVKAEDPSAQISLVGIYDENDEIIFEMSDEEGDFSNTMFGFEPVTDKGGELAVFLPGTPDSMLEPGSYLFVFQSDGAPLSEGHAIIRSGDVSGMQALDITFWVVSPASELTSEESQSEFADAIRGPINDLLNPHKLEVGQINFAVGTDDDMDNFGTVNITEDDDSAVGDLCATMTDEIGTSRSLPVAIIDEFPADDTGSTTGIAYSAGNAGIIDVAGSPYSCVVVTWNDYATSFVDQAANIIHEGSHFMSLPHTTEQEGQTFDLFSDTPECPADQFDQDGDGLVDEVECGVEGGAKNYMFWNGSEELAPFEMSADQAWVLRRHPLFHNAGA